MLELENIVLFFPPDRWLFSRLNFALAERETVHIIGTSGSGKTRLIEVILGMTLPQEGQVLWDGEDICGWTEEKRRTLCRTQAAVLSRNPGFFPRMEMVDNVSLPLLLMGVSRREARAKAREEMVRLGVESAIRRMPERLSWVESCRLQLARASLLPKRLLILDNFFADVSEEEAKRLWELCRAVQWDLEASLLVLGDREWGDPSEGRTLLLENGNLHEQKPKGGR